MAKNRFKTNFDKDKAKEIVGSNVPEATKLKMMKTSLLTHISLLIK